MSIGEGDIAVQVFADGGGSFKDDPEPFRGDIFLLLGREASLDELRIDLRLSFWPDESVEVVQDARKAEAERLVHDGRRGKGDRSQGDSARRVVGGTLTGAVEAEVRFEQLAVGWYSSI